MEKLLLIALFFTGIAAETAHAQREGGAYWGSFSRGNSSGASTYVWTPQPTSQSVVRRKNVQARSARARSR
jgi:hypothetical protein